MDWFERHCACLESPDVVLHLGAGRCAELGVYATLDRSRVVLVDPQAETADRLRRLSAALSNVEVRQVAVAAEAGEAPLHLYNMAEFNSLRRPTGLRVLLPGLAQVGTAIVDTLSLADLAAQFQIDVAADNWLVVDAPGVESAIVDAVTDGELGRCFSHIFLRAGALPLFEDADTADGLLKRLASLGYEIFSTADTSDPDLPRYHLRLNPAAVEVVALREQIAARKTEDARAAATVARRSAKDARGPASKWFSEPFEASAAVKRLVEDCLAEDDLHQSIDRAVVSGSYVPTDLVQMYLLLASTFQEQEDRLSAVHFLKKARELLASGEADLSTALVKGLIEAGEAGEALDEVVGRLLADAEAFVIINGKLSSKSRPGSGSTEHGHQLLITHLGHHFNEYIAALSDRKAVLIEIGSTREDVQGQGSTRKLADFCSEHDIHFTTVDMDPHNTRQAEMLFEDMDANCRAVNAKGEDFLRDYDGPIDFLFLDAYDFDHGKHSALRQERYEKFLEGRISDGECHRMHLECARHAAEKVPADGLVCVDDAWLESGSWMGKGTLAVPYLLENGFDLTAIGPKAVLLRKRAC